MSRLAVDHRELCDKYKSFLGADGKESSTAQFLARNSAQVDVFSSGRGLFSPAEAIVRGTGRLLEKSTNEVAIFEKLEDFVTLESGPDDRERQHGAECVLMDKLLNDMMRRLLPSEDVRSELLDNMNPLMGDVRLIKKRTDSNDAASPSIQTDVAFALQLLVESYKSFLCSDETTPQIVNCRIQMLNLSQQVRNTLKKTRELRPFIHDKCCDFVCDTRVLSSRIWTLELDLMALTTQKIFDLYHQAPWVAGSQMIEILSRATESGVKLCNKHQVLWAVLHLYNLLRQCGAIEEEVVLLENLCSTFGKRVFRGEPPQRDFWTRYKVCNGGRLEFLRSKRHLAGHRHNHSDEDKYCTRSERKWRVTMPRSTYDYANTNHELNSHLTSVAAALHTCGFQPSCCAWPYAWRGTDRSKLPNEEEIKEVAHQVAAHPLVFALDHLENALGPELQGDFPTGRLNWFEIFLTVTEILGEMGRAGSSTCPECRKAASDAELWVQLGCLAVEELMERADEYEVLGCRISDPSI